MTLSSGGSFGSPPDLQQIVAGLDREIAENPSNALAYNRRGIAYFLLKQYQQAIENYNRAIELDTNCAAWYFNRGQAFAALGHAQSAATDFSRAYALDPQLMPHDQQPRHALPMGEALTAPYPSCQKVYHLQYWFLYADLIAIVFLILPVITLLVAITSPASFYGSQAVILISFSLFSLIL